MTPSVQTRCTLWNACTAAEELGGMVVLPRKEAVAIWQTMTPKDQAMFKTNDFGNDGIVFTRAETVEGGAE